MGRRNGHQRMKRKRRVIDLKALTKKQRKEYRQTNQGASIDKRAMPDLHADTEETDGVNQLPGLASSSDDEDDAYSQLLSSVSGSARPIQHYAESEEESLSDSEEEEEEFVKRDSKEEADEPEDLADEEEQQEEEDEEEEKDGNEDFMLQGETKQTGDYPEEVSGEEDISSDVEILEDGDNPDDFLIKENDPFSIHFEKDLTEKFAEELGTGKLWTKKEIKIPGVGSGIKSMSDLKHTPSKYKREKDLKILHVKQRLCAQVEETMLQLCNKGGEKGEGCLTGFQQGLFSCMNNYQDIYYPNRTFENAEEIRMVYCLHALNHVLKTRSRIIAHNTKMKQKKDLTADEDYRDHGLTRPKVLILVPFRESALRIVNTMVSLVLPTDEKFVSNKKRFQEEFGLSKDDEVTKGFKPEDYEATFAGNNDEHFRIGIGVAKKTLKLYTKFYSSDIILASPLGLRTLIGAEGEKERDHDFLNSIEILILDQADIFLMQNWDHVLHIMNHLHLQPSESHGVDFSRVRMWILNGWSKFYRQNLIFSSIQTPEITSLFNKHCHNYAGKLHFSKPVTDGSICQIVTQLPQVFHRIESSNYVQMPEDRFKFFVKKILPTYKDPLMAQTLIFVPSYFDFVRLRNYFTREEMDFVQINEYSKDKNISRARNLFFHGKVALMLYTERCHFYRRFRIRGINHIIFYGLPSYGHFYSEMCNMLQEKKKRTNAGVNHQTCTVLYSRYEAQRLSDIIGTDRAAHMLNSDKGIHMFVTGENG
ncbi:hypothetical protein CHS0354_016280 [Potamilus streckersoni]|uniref:U3 small nucleolar RNA-associated protein 25 homolog n=1 Tax=Potamilus streckersoni TaxID=2493646 RepID=A0AAE0RXK3_9BIVA|nr:hypothetical protein CHS0354_016280 [Potamilus streckersoni]